MNECIDAYLSKYLNGNSPKDSLEIFQLCEICEKYLTEPILLPCLHIFDKNCIIGMDNDLLDYNQIKCPKCDFTTVLSISQPLNLNIFNKKSDSISKDLESDDNINKCILCTNDEIGIYKCSDCAGIICERCRVLHKEVVIFQSHTNIQELTQKEKDNIKDLVKFLAENKPARCHIHKEINIDIFCYKCFVGLCSKCKILDHKNHETVALDELFEHLNKDFDSLVSKCKATQEKLGESVEKLNWSLSEISKSRNLNKTQIESSFEIWKSTIEKMKDELILQNRNHHDNLEYKIMSQINQNQKSSDHIDSTMKFINLYLKKCSFLEASKLVKPTLDCLTSLSALKCDTGKISTSVLIQCPNAEFIKSLVRSHFGTFPNSDSFANSGHSSYFQENGLFQSNSVSGANPGLLNLGTPEPIDSINMYSPSSGNFEEAEMMSNKESIPFQSKLGQLSSGSGNTRIVANNSFTGLDSLSHPGNLPLPFIHQTSNDYFSYSNEISPLMTSKGSISASTDSGQFISHPLYDDNSLTSSILPRMGPDFSTLDNSQVNLNMQFNNNAYRPLVNMNPVPKPPFPNRNRNYVPMVIKERWGSQGSNRGQLNSPHGFCLGFGEEIVVADTQNHRIHIFSKDGQFISQFGIAGREEGHLWHPRKVTIIRNTQHYVVCDRGSERSRMQIFAKNGYFIRKIAIPFIDIVAGLAINSMGHIVAVDSVSPTIFVVTEMGEMVKWIECSSQMREPSDIVVHGENYYICDFKGHCVCVYKQDGTFLFRFGNEKITNYPNGIDISNHGDILVGDSHGNRFHVAVFTKDGQLTGEFECPSVKVSRACGLKITSEGYLVTLAKNNHNVLVIDTLYVN